MKIAGREIGDGAPVFIIAEAGVNHNGRLDLAKRLVDEAKKAGVDAVKFQTFKAENLITASAPRASYQIKNVGGSETQYEMLKRLELDYGDFITLKKYCDSKGIMFLSTPHTNDAVSFLDRIVPAFKIGSGDLNNIPLLEYVASFRKPIILSAGMGTMREVSEAVESMKKAGNSQLILLHCTTNYPCPPEQVNMRSMLSIRKETGCITGYSDHTEGIAIPLLAAALGAAVIEKHFTLDRGMDGPDHKASLDPAGLKEMVRAVRELEKSGRKGLSEKEAIKFVTESIPDMYRPANLEDMLEKAMGSGIKKPTGSETEIMKQVRKSIVALVDIPQGSVIREDMLIIKRPGTGIEPKRIRDVIGRKAKRDIRKDEMISFGRIS